MLNETNDWMFRDLNQSGVEILPEFFEKSEEAIQEILNEATPLKMQGNVINGQGDVIKHVLLYRKIKENFVRNGIVWSCIIAWKYRKKYKKMYVC